MKKVFIFVICLFCISSIAVADTYRPGKCPITGRKIISPLGRPLRNYRVVWFELSNGSRMPLAVDKFAVDRITSADFEKIMEHVRAGWEWEILQKKWTPQEIEDYKKAFFDLTIVEVIE